MLLFFSHLSPCLIGMEACAGAHYWARELVKLGPRPIAKDYETFCHAGAIHTRPEGNGEAPRLPDVEGDKPKWSKIKCYPIGIRPLTRRETRQARHHAQAHQEGECSNENRPSLGRENRWINTDTQTSPLDTIGAWRHSSQPSYSPQRFHFCFDPERGMSLRMGELVRILKSEGPCSIQLIYGARCPEDGASGTERLHRCGCFGAFPHPSTGSERL